MNHKLPLRQKWQYSKLPDGTIHVTAREIVEQWVQFDDAGYVYALKSSTRAREWFASDAGRWVTENSLYPPEVIEEKSPLTLEKSCAIVAYLSAEQITYYNLRFK